MDLGFDAALTNDFCLARQMSDLGPVAEGFSDLSADGLCDGMWLLRRGTPDLLWVSPTFCRVLGLGRDQLESVRAQLGEMTRVLFGDHASGAEPFDRLLRFQHASGAAVWLRARAVALQGSGGALTGLCAQFHDVTATVQRAHRLEEQVERGARAEIDLRAFSYSVSHELRAPATTSLTLIDLVMDELGARHCPAPKVSEFLGHASATLTRMVRLIDGAADFSQLRAPPEGFARIDLNALTERALDDLAEVIARTGARIDTAPLGHVYGAPDLLRRLIVQLLTNALTYAKPGQGPVVSVKARVMDVDMLELCVRDEGIGIAPEYHSRIFDLFARLHRDEAIPGSGLGLAFCAQVAALHGGSIAVRSDPGEGAAFLVRLPKGRV